MTPQGTDHALLICNTCVLSIGLLCYIIIPILVREVVASAGNHGKRDSLPLQKNE